MQENSQNSF